MSSFLALLFCTIFVLFLLRLDRKQSPAVSGVLWIPTIWMLSIAIKPLSNWFGNAGHVNEGSVLDRSFLIVLLLIGFFLLIKRRFYWSRAIKENIWLILLISYMLVSILWADILFIAFKRWIRELVALIMAFLVLTERNPRKAVECIFRRIIYICIPFSLLLVKYYPGYGIAYNWGGDQMWIGVTLQKNGLGRLCLIAAFFIIWTFIRRWQGRDTFAVKYQTYAEMVLLIFTLWLLKGPSIGAMSATGVTSLSFGLMAFACLLWMKKCKIYLGTITLQVIIATVIVFGTTAVFTGGSAVGSFTSTVGRDKTLTGRTEIWAELLPVAMLHPFEGYGGFWTQATRDKHGLSEAHSGYLDIILDYGFVGLMFFSMFLLSSCWKAQRILSYDYDWGSLWICYLLMAVIHNITETSFDSLTSHLTAILLFMAVSSTTSTRYKTGSFRRNMITHNRACL